MSKQNLNIEEIFQHAFEKHAVSPSKKVLLQLKRKLWMKDFFSFRLTQLNIYYVLFLAGGVTAMFLTGDNAPESEHVKLKDLVQEKIKIIASDNNAEDEAIKPEKEIQPEHTDEEEKEAFIPQADFHVSSVQGCAPLKVNFENLSRHAEAFSWDFGDGTENHQDNPAHVYTAPGTYTARLEVKGDDGITDEKVKRITVLEGPVASFKVDASESSNKRRTIKFVNKSENAREYLWIFGDGETSREREPVHTYEVYQTYMVKLLATAPNGCTDTTKVLTTFLKEQYGLSFPREFMPNPLGPLNNGYYMKSDLPGTIFHPHHNGVMKYKLTIKAPDGNKIFSTQQVEQGWNGYIQGRPASQGKYLWRAKGRFINGEEFSMSGYVTLQHEGIHSEYDQ